MSWDYTELQSGDDQQQARELSLRHTRPPTQVPGYDLTRFLGSGAYGEVWIGLDRNTGRQVAVKFYQHRSDVDWAMLSREVEKLVLLSTDRYVVQLLDVGWQADPPYYVMEYIERGSLDQLIQRNERLTVDAIVELFREIVIGLNHAHAKGILHCDLKPANVLLDQDDKPRLADFGQSRLTYEQTPSLGTLFYMAPEQADLKALPDARWDVYALGAILYCMLTGKPPHCHEELVQAIEAAPELSSRLRCYRQWITTRKPPDEHRRVPGVDRALASIVDRCLAPRPSRRFANVQEVLDALRARDQARARRPLLVTGVVGPVLLLAVMVIWGVASYQDALKTSDAAVREKVWQSNAFAAKFVAASCGTEIQRYFRAADSAARDERLRQLVTQLVDERAELLEELSDPHASRDELEVKRRQFEQDPLRTPLQEQILSLIGQGLYPENIASFFVCGPRGTHLAGWFNDQVASTIGHNFAYRSYCHGGLRDLDESDRPMPTQHVRQTSLSAPLLSKSTGRWKIAVSTPVYRQQQPHDLLGVIVMSVDVGTLISFEADTDRENQFAVLVDGRDNGYQGVVLDHPLYTSKYEQVEGVRGSEFDHARIAWDRLEQQRYEYVDPLTRPRQEGSPPRRWIAAWAPVEIRPDTGPHDLPGADTGLVVLVQEDRDASTEPVSQLAHRLSRTGLGALGVFMSVVGVLWYFVLRVQGITRWWKRPPFTPSSTIASPTPTQVRSASSDTRPR